MADNNFPTNTNRIERARPHHRVHQPRRRTQEEIIARAREHQQAFMALMGPDAQPPPLENFMVQNPPVNRVTRTYYDRMPPHRMAPPPHQNNADERPRERTRKTGRFDE